MKKQNLFEKIIAKEIPAHIVYENEHFCAFLDISPKAPGHLLLVPKISSRWVWDVPRYDEYWRCAKKLALALRTCFSVDMICSSVYGEEVPHAHIHLWPEVPKDGSEKEFKTIAEKIKKAL